MDVEVGRGGSGRRRLLLLEIGGQVVKLEMFLQEIFQRDERIRLYRPDA